MCASFRAVLKQEGSLLSIQAQRLKIQTPDSDHVVHREAIGTILHGVLQSNEWQQ